MSTSWKRAVPLLWTVLFSHATTTHWLDVQEGSNSQDKARGVAVDSTSNVYVAGDTTTSLYGTSGGGGGSDLIGAMFDSAGTRQWGVQESTSSADTAYSVAVDSSSNVYVAGVGGSLYGTNAGGNDIVVAKFNRAGTRQWGVQEGTSSDDTAYGVAVDSSSNVYVAGYTQGSLYGTNAGSRDLFLVKFNSAGTRQWGVQEGTSSDDTAYGVAVDSYSNVYVVGYTYGSLYGNHAGVDIVIVKFNSAGTRQWGVQEGSSSDEGGFGVAVDSSSNVYVVGYTYGSLYGNHAGRHDLIVAKFNSAGTRQWGVQEGTSSDDFVRGVSVDPSSSVYIAGYTAGSLYDTNMGGDDLFVAKFNTAGTRQWSIQEGTSSSDQAYGVALDCTYVYVAGSTQGSLHAANAGGTDLFISRYEGATCDENNPNTLVIVLTAVGLGLIGVVVLCCVVCLCSLLCGLCALLGMRLVFRQKRHSVAVTPNQSLHEGKLNPTPLALNTPAEVSAMSAEEVAEWTACATVIKLGLSGEALLACDSEEQLEKLGIADGDERGRLLAAVRCTKLAGRSVSEASQVLRDVMEKSGLSAAAIDESVAALSSCDGNTLRGLDTHEKLVAAGVISVSARQAILDGITSPEAMAVHPEVFGSAVRSPPRLSDILGAAHPGNIAEATGDTFASYCSFENLGMIDRAELLACENESQLLELGVKDPLVRRRAMAEIRCTKMASMSAEEAGELLRTIASPADVEPLNHLRGDEIRALDSHEKLLAAGVTSPTARQAILDKITCPQGAASATVLPRPVSAMEPQPSVPVRLAPRASSAPVVAKAPADVEAMTAGSIAEWTGCGDLARASISGAVLLACDSEHRLEELGVRDATERRIVMAAIRSTRLASSSPEEAARTIGGWLQSDGIPSDAAAALSGLSGDQNRRLDTEEKLMEAGVMNVNARRAILERLAPSTQEPDPETDIVATKQRNTGLVAPPPKDLSNALRREDIEIGDVIGQGSFKSVHRGTFHGVPVAVIRLRKGDSSEAELDNEEKILSALSLHPYLTRLYGRSKDTDGSTLLVMQLAEFGSLDPALKEVYEGKLSLHHRLAIAYQVADGMQALHSRKVLHRDLSARNVLISRLDIDRPGVVRVLISDFGMSKITSHYSDMNQYYSKGTDLQGGDSNALIPVRWCPPEVLTKGKFSPKSDVWAYGVLLWEVWSDIAIPYSAVMDDTAVFDFVTSGKRLKKPEGCPEEVFTIMTECWNESPTDRPSFNKLSEMVVRAAKSLIPDIEPVHLCGTGMQAQASSCVICMERGIEVIIAPCGHKCVCKEDGHALVATAAKCPICRATCLTIVESVYES